MEALETKVDKPPGSGFCCVPLNSGERAADCFLLLYLKAQGPTVKESSVLLNCPDSGCQL